ncbi:oxidoreductase [Aspergillus sclerotiicarbonarius CBS 121057]|uniref:Oxidoreductase n=1 Tax=Aspergillus sclerotiicarbonarius (strain CBS 121057 / IBT 28362) TaxID=1448318 RepID=A0A319FP69_ASPSB|nr:oxidoreductase [Aspergillus sclerotiicarbonarius CBS 121057]
MLPKPHQIGIIGYGLSAKIFHIPYLMANRDFELRAIVQRSGDEAAQENPGVRVYRSAGELFADAAAAAVDVVVVATPPETHFGIVVAALEGGMHVIVEKPFCPSSRECNELITLAKNKGLVLTEFQNRRWDADFVTLRKILDDGRLGRVVELESHFDRYESEVPVSGSWAGGHGDVCGRGSGSGSGAIYDLGTHLIDQVVVGFGLPCKVTGFLGVQRGLRDEGGPQDACTVLLHYESGLLVTVKASAVSPERAQLRFWVRGDKGSFKKYHLDPQESQLVGGMKVNNPMFGWENTENAGVITLATDGILQEMPCPNLPPPTYRAFYDHLSRALAGQGDVPVSPKDARNVIRLVELATQSSETGATITLNPEEFA